MLAAVWLHQRSTLSTFFIQIQRTANGHVLQCNLKDEATTQTRTVKLSAAVARTRNTLKQLDTRLTVHTDI